MAAAVRIFESDRALPQRAGVVHQPMIAKILDAARRAMATQIVRTGAVDQPYRPQGPRHEAAVVERADANHAVEAFAHDIDATVGAADLDRKLGIPVEEFRQSRNHEARCHARRHVDTQAALQRATVSLEHAVQLVHVIEQIPRTLVERLPVRGQLDPARGPMEELRAKAGLQPLHGDRYRCLGQREAVRGPGETAEFGDAQNDAQRVEGIHGPDRWSIVYVLQT